MRQKSSSSSELTNVNSRAKSVAVAAVNYWLLSPSSSAVATILLRCRKGTVWMQR